MTFARELHAKYSAMEGSAQIALIYSLEQLDALLKLYRPTHILELGGGIGTISELLLLKSDAKIEVVENNDFCIEKMVKNLSHLREYELIVDYKFLSSGSQADMLIVDVNNGIFNISKLKQRSIGTTQKNSPEIFFIANLIADPNPSLFF